MTHQFTSSPKITDLKRLTIFALLVMAFVVSGPSTASAQAPITARVDRTSLALDEQVVLTVTVTGDFLKIPRPDLAELEDFVVVSSSTSTQVSIVNGEMTSQGVFIYRLQPLEEGSLEIPPISVNLSGELYQTDPIGIEVFASNTRIAPQNQNNAEAETPSTLQGQDYFVEGEVDNQNPYLGQQIVYIFRIYQAVGFPPGQPDYTPPAFTDFWSHEITSQPHYDIEVSGRNYLVTEILTALFPANLGQITIEPASLVIPGGLLNPDIRLETEPVSISVHPLPEAGKPENFGGAVGKFNINARLSETEIKENTPVTLVTEVEGVGNIQTFTEPELPEMLDWRIFESQSSVVTETSSGQLRGTRTFERLVVPSHSGDQMFPPIEFSYYDPELDAYQIISTNPVPITVLPDDTQPMLPTAVDVGSASQINELNISDIRHIKPVPSSLGSSTIVSQAGEILYWAAWITPLFLIAGVFVWQRRKERLERDTAYARNYRAKRNALNILANARTENAGEQAAAAGRALLGYLSDKLNRPTAGLTTGGLINLLHRSKVEPDLVERIEAILNQIDVGRFAPVSAGDAESLVNATHSLIEDLEKSFNKRRR